MGIPITQRLKEIKKRRAPDEKSGQVLRGKHLALGETNKQCR